MTDIIEKKNNHIKKSKIGYDSTLQAYALIKCPNCGKPHALDAMADAAYKCQRCNEDFGYDKKLIY